MTDTAQCAKCAYKIDLPHSDMLEIFYKDHNCELTALQEAIARVRELANYWLTGQSDEIPYDAGQFATALLKAVDGEQ